MQPAAKVYPFPSTNPAADRPPPLFLDDADMSGLHFMPVPTDMLLGSRDWSRAKREPLYAYRFMTLAMAAFRQRPAGSLPDDDLCLADALGIDDEAWSLIKPDTMREWVLCSDGRWHHPVVAEIAALAWTARKANKSRNAGMLAGKEAKRAADGAAIHDERRDDHRDDGRDHVVTRREGRKEGREGSEGLEENERISSASPGGEPKKARGGLSHKGSRIPTDWQPDRTYAEGQGLRTYEIDREAESFRAYWQAKSGSNALKCDWAAVWRMWVRTYVDRRAQRPAATPHRHPDSF